jgi:hydrogenase assembly chaperone HypC/HupF
MCLDFCAQVVERDKDEVVVEGNGMRRRASTLLVPDVAVGDWVRVALGSVVERLDEAAALNVNQFVRTARGVPA